MVSLTQVLIKTFLVKKLFTVKDISLLPRLFCSDSLKK